MKQIANSAGQIQVVEVPAPSLQPGGVLIATSHSLISVGTESSNISTGGGKENLLLKAIRNPHLVRKVVARASSRGLSETFDLVRSRISDEVAMGYSCSGRVIEVSPGMTDLRPGDRVACAGAGYANHAEYNFVPRNLVARLPDNVTYEEGAFGTLGAIALQGVRRCGPELGDRVVVVGLGLLGQLSAQLLKQSGAFVIGVDIRNERVQLALKLGIDSGFALAERKLAEGVGERTKGRGADAVLLTAASADKRLLDRCFEACRKRGRVILVGDVPIRISRDRIYQKELDFRISTSYGPGRYDPEYEEQGRDYPYAYVRWTEGRNLEEVCRLIGNQQLKIRPLIDQIHPAAEATQAYAGLSVEPRPIGVLLDFQLDPTKEKTVPSWDTGTSRKVRSRTGNSFRVGVIGYSSYFRSVLQPLLRQHPGFELSAVHSRNGLTFRGAVERGEFERGTTRHEELLADPDIDVIYITTRHHQHYPLAKGALLADKSVFVEKPMTMTSEEGLALMKLVQERDAVLTVGFNRRFSPLAVQLKAQLKSIAPPKTMIYRINAGPLPADHWLLDPEQGGGRILGEGVHFVDFLTFLAGSYPVRWQRISPPSDYLNEATVSLAFADGSTGVVVYSGQGTSSVGKERVEVLAGGKICLLDDFKSLTVRGGSPTRIKTKRVEKGQAEQLENFLQALRGEAGLGVTVEDGYRATLCLEPELEDPTETPLP